jgi:hypothetical protein
VSATCLRDREGRWSWRLTRESGVRPSAGCLKHIGNSAEDIRGAYVVMEFELLYPGTSAVEWRSFVGRVDKETVGTVVKIAEAFKVVEAAVEGQERAVEMARFLYVCLWGRLREGWFSSEGKCECDARRLFAAQGSRCQTCSSVPLLSRRILSQSEFAGVFPLGMRHWWKGVTDATSGLARWRQAGLCIEYFGETCVCKDCVKAVSEVLIS